MASVPSGVGVAAGKPMTSQALQDIVALFGCPAAGNPAQYLFERAISEAGLDCRFVSVDVAVDRLEVALAGAAAMGFRGLLLAGPLRVAALPLVCPSAASAFAGAVSLVEHGPDGWIAHMTDGRGVVEAVRAHLDPSGKGVLVLGAGPSGRAAALEFVLAGAAAVTVCDPDDARADALVGALAALDGSATITRGSWPAVVVSPEVRVVVAALDSASAETTFVGLRPDIVVAEVALAAEPGRVGRAAQAAGACLVDGLEVHAAQTAIDFGRITGAVADPDLLREALDEFLAAP
jgi:shikimate dehydrogenase